MGLLGGMKEKLGFGERPEWQDEDVYDDNAPDGYYEDRYPEDEDPDYGETPRDNVSFDAYDPNKFEHVTLSSDRELRVASFADEGGSPQGYSGYANSYGSNIGTSASRFSTSVRPVERISRDSSRSSSAESTGGWSSPEDPSFLSNPAPKYNRDIYDSSIGTSGADPYSEFDSDVKFLHRDPSSRLEIVKPTGYSDVEKIANACKAGKSVVLVLIGTKTELAKRILDFSFGVASALNGSVDKAADKVFVISKRAGTLSDAERDYLRKSGILK